MPIMRPYNPWENGDPFGTSERLESGEGFKLLQWPIKLWNISETAPYFHHAHLLVVADCAALCHINIHDRITPGRIPLLCCPETDFDISMKLFKIIELNDIRSVAVVKMNAECCADLTEYVQTAIKMSRKPLPLQTINVFVDAEEVE